jgi:hypothetical protein
MPAPLKRQIYETLKAALDSDTEDERYDYIGEDERTAIRTILAETLPEFRSILEQT